MRLRLTEEQKTKTIKKKNPIHWSNRKETIKMRRRQERTRLKRLNTSYVSVINENSFIHGFGHLTLNEMSGPIAIEENRESYPDLDDESNYFLDDNERNEHEYSDTSGEPWTAETMENTLDEEQEEFDDERIHLPKISRDNHFNELISNSIVVTFRIFYQLLPL